MEASKIQRPQARANTLTYNHGQAAHTHPVEVVVIAVVVLRVQRAVAAAPSGAAGTGVTDRGPEPGNHAPEPG